MKNYEYKFVEVKLKSGLRVKTGATFEECKKVILAESKQGWRLKQVVTPINEKVAAGGALGYQVIFERETD